MNYQKVTESIVNWLKDKVNEAGAQGVVLGLSGGIDSAVVMVLCQKAFAQNSLGLIMPCFSDPKDVADAKLAAEKFGFPYKVINLEKTFNALVEAAGEIEISERKKIALANIKPRLRMTALYYEAALRNYLVVGTGNKSEIVVGYYTKYGDAGVDLEPIGGLVKSQVIELARYLGVPETIITKPPSAGLWQNQTDEEEMGLTYEELDQYILTGQGKPEKLERIRHLIRVSEHKRQLPPIAPVAE